MRYCSAVVFALTLLFFGCQSAESDLASEEGVTVTTQPTQERIWTEADFELLWEVDDPDLVLNPVLPKEYDGELFVLDHGDSRVKRFDREGNLLSIIGEEGEGQGPGELGALTDVTVRGDSVWIATPRRHRISLFTRDGTYLSQFRTEHGGPWRVEPVGERLAMFKVRASNPFHVRSFDGHHLFSFGEHIAEQVINPVARNGRLVGLENDYLLYAARYLGHFRVYDANGNLQRVIATIDGMVSHDDEGEPTESGIVFEAPESEIRLGEVSIHDDTLYAITFLDDEDSTVAVVDRYAWPEGEYLNSTRLPRRGPAFVGRDRIYFAIGASVLAYRFDG